MEFFLKLLNFLTIENNRVHNKNIAKHLPFNFESYKFKDLF